MLSRSEVLWGKTAAASRTKLPTDAWHPLHAHAIDTAAVARWLWQESFSPAMRQVLASGLGIEAAKSLFVWLAGLHDLGKAFAGFQAKSLEHARLSGLPLPAQPGTPHALVSGLGLQQFLRIEHGWPTEVASWPALIVAGHHGMFPGPAWDEAPPLDWCLEDPQWRAVRMELARSITARLKADPSEWQDHRPALASQLAMTGAVILADWLASNEAVFPYTFPLPEDYDARAARQADQVRNVMGIAAPWRPSPAADVVSHFAARWPGRPPRQIQRTAFEVAADSTRTGCLVLIEAPMGIGKTEAALTVAELLAAATGRDGLFIGLPTQATTNAVFGRVRDWLEVQGGGVTVALAHGKANRHPDYRQLLLNGIGVDAGGAITASQWLAGPKKALLAPVVVGTVDQLLLAAVASRHVALRHLGLAGKVVIVDEVHAYDAYMSVLLQTALAWLGAAGVPVVLLSATLPARARRDLLTAYTGYEQPTASGAYPLITRAEAPGQVSEEITVSEHPCASESLVPPVRIELRPESSPGNVPRLAGEFVEAGGCVLVIRNTVRRAQETHQDLALLVGTKHVTLAHSRFTMADRRRIDDQLLMRFGPPPQDAEDQRRAPEQQPMGREDQRPSRHVVVATQVLEQSLDVDFDALISDAAPIDLLLQRMGRMFRHPRQRPSHLAEPRMLVVGFEEGTVTRPATFPRGSEYVYGRHLLLRTMARFLDQSIVRLPDDVRQLIDDVYGTDMLGPASWHEAMDAAAQAERDRLQAMRTRARQIALPDPATGSLFDIHRASVGDAIEEATPQVQAHVRMGAPTIEVLLLRKATPTSATTVSHGIPTEVPLDRLPGDDQLEAVLDQSLRLPPGLTAQAADRARVPPAWRGHPWLSRAPVLLLPTDGALRLGRTTCTYTPERGLEVT